MSLIPSNIVKDSSKSLVLCEKTSNIDHNRLLQSNGMTIGKESINENTNFHQDLNWKVISPPILVTNEHNNTDQSNSDKILDVKYAWNIKGWKSWARGNWISSHPNNNMQNPPAGDYTYQTTFDYPTIDNISCNHNSSNNNSCASNSSSNGSDSTNRRVCEMCMSFQYAADDYVTSISLNHQIVYECSHTTNHTTPFSSTTNDLVSDKAASTKRMKLVSLPHSSPQSKPQRITPCRDEYKRLQKKIIHGLIYESSNTLEFVVHNKVLPQSKKNQQQQRKSSGSGITVNGNSNNGETNPTGFLFKFGSITLGNCSTITVESAYSTNNHNLFNKIDSTDPFSYFTLTTTTIISLFNSNTKDSTLATSIIFTGIAVVLLLLFCTRSGRKQIKSKSFEIAESNNNRAENVTDSKRENENVTDIADISNHSNNELNQNYINNTNNTSNDNSASFALAAATTLSTTETTAPTTSLTKITSASVPKTPLTPTHIPKSILIHNSVPILNTNADKTSTISSTAANNNQTTSLTTADDVYHSVSPNKSNLNIQVHSEGTAMDDEISDIVSVYSKSSSTTPSHNNNRSSNRHSFNDNSHNNSYSSIHNATTTTSTTRSQPSSLKKQKQSPRISGSSGSGTSRSNITVRSAPNSARKQLSYEEEYMHKLQLQHSGEISTIPNTNTSNNNSSFDASRSRGSRGSSSNHSSHKKITYNIYTGHSEIVDSNTAANAIVTMPITPNKKTISSFSTPQSSPTAASQQQQQQQQKIPLPPLSPVLATPPILKSTTSIQATTSSTAAAIDKNSGVSSSISTSAVRKNSKIESKTSQTIQPSNAAVWETPYPDTNTKPRDHSKYLNDTSTSQTPTFVSTSSHNTHIRSSVQNSTIGGRKQQQQTAYTTPHNTKTATTSTTAATTTTASVTHNMPANARETWKTVQKDLMKHQESQSSGWKDISAEDMIRL